MLNCWERECRNLHCDAWELSICKVLNIEEPDDMFYENNIDCKHFEQSRTCRECKHSILKFSCSEELDFEEDFRCKFDKNIYTQYIHSFQQDDDYQCECGKFEYLD